MKAIKLIVFLVILPIVISCSEELSEGIKFLNSYKQARFLEEVSKQNIKTKMDEQKFIRFSAEDKDKAWKIMQAVDEEYFNGFKFQDSNRKEDFLRRLDSNNIKYRLVENRLRMSHESIEFTELEELVLVDDDKHDQAFRLFIPPDTSYPSDFLIDNIDNSKWTYAEYTDHNKQIYGRSEARIVATNNLDVIGFSCTYDSKYYDKPLFFYRYNTEPHYKSGAKEATVTLSIQNHPPHNESLQIIGYIMPEAFGNEESKLAPLINNVGSLKYQIYAKDESLSVNGEVKLDNFKESLSGMLDSCKRNQF